MTFSAGTWALLLLGVILTRRWSFIERHGSVAAPILVGITLCSEWITQCFGTGDASQRLLTTVTALGFIVWMVTLRNQSHARHWGAVAWSSAGLLIVGQSTDLVTIGLGWELLRHGTRLAS
ncbi:MAG TPA: hypothetical protein VFG20_07435, partial [Planctomycetaceae bacterium]|nr:hypothetical protein [Planctomycetaceae bacterium]